MKKLVIIILVSFTLFSCQKASIENLFHKENHFVEGGEDIPLFEGLYLLKEESSAFDSVSGNIISSTYIGNVKSEKIKKFYMDALPQLGWVLVDEDMDKIVFKRDEDDLEINFNYASKGLYVKFFISSISN